MTTNDCNMNEMTAAALARIAAHQSSDPETDDLTVPLALECAEKDAEIERLQAAVERMGIGINHIATYRTDAWPPYGSEPLDALEKLGAGQEYDMWCCWNAAMCARDICTQSVPNGL